MTLTHVTLVHRAGADVTLTAAVLRDILWAHVRAGDPVEHISVRAGPESCLEVGMFTKPTTGQSPATIASELVERALRSSPSLERWMLAEIRPSSLFANSGP